MLLVDGATLVEGMVLIDGATIVGETVLTAGLGTEDGDTL